MKEIQIQAMKSGELPACSKAPRLENPEMLQVFPGQFYLLSFKSLESLTGHFSLMYLGHLKFAITIPSSLFLYILWANALLCKAGGDYPTLLMLDAEILEFYESTNTFYQLIFVGSN